jgi:hypothetical protein
MFNLVGPAYIHRIMKGEQWDKGLTENITLVQVIKTGPDSEPSF